MIWERITKGGDITSSAAAARPVTVLRNGSFGAISRAHSQMAKTAAALARLGKVGVPYVSVLTDPTTGGVSASLAMLGDVNIAEPGALIGFAGPRGIEQTVREKLPEGFQRSEFLLDHGAIDMIIDRRQMREQIADLLAKFERRPSPIAQ